MSEQPGDRDAPREADERPDVREAMAVYSAEGQADDETGGDAAAGARLDTSEAAGAAEDDREPHGPS